MRFFLDANLPISTTYIFEGLNLEAIHARKVGLGKATDDQIIKYALKNNSILVTKDMDFTNITKFPIKEHNGIIVLRLPNYFTASQINNSLRDFLISTKNKDLTNAITIVKLGRYRIRKLK